MRRSKVQVRPSSTCLAQAIAFSTRLIHASIVDVKPDPMAGVVHVPLLQIARVQIQCFVQRLVDDTQFNQALSENLRAAS